MFVTTVYFFLSQIFSSRKWSTTLVLKMLGEYRTPGPIMANQILRYILPHLLNCCSELNINILSGTWKDVRSVFVHNFLKYIAE